MKLSIIIPTLGRETLKEVLQGIRACENFEKINPEVIVVFDGIKNPGSKFPEPGFKVLETGQKLGASGARNLGIEKATGDILVFVGDDTIPEVSWLKNVQNFHESYPEGNRGLLGMVSWVPELAKDPFHKWLLNHAQFAFGSIKKKGATWRHFYTSNISVKRSLVGDTRFPENFKGWGFEDILFGYELHKKGLKLTFDEQCEVLHNHPQSLGAVLAHTRNARKNAKVLEEKTGINILPQGFKLIVLKLVIFVGFIFSFMSPKIGWWVKWKKVWIDKK